MDSTRVDSAALVRVALLSEHASPMALLGGEDAGGQNVYVDEVSRHLALMGNRVDIFTRRDSLDAPEVIEWGEGVRIVNLTAGPAHFLPKDDIWTYMPAFCDSFVEFMRRDGGRYDVVHGNFWMSGWAAVELRRRLGIPVVQIFHATGKTKQRHQGTADTSPDGRIAVELEVVRGVDRIIAQCPCEESELIDDYGAAAEKIVTIPSAVNTGLFRPVSRTEARQKIGLEPAGAPVVVYVGRMLPRKDVRNLLRAASILIEQSGTRLQLLLVGGDSIDPDPAITPEIGQLQHLASELGITDRVHLTGKRQADVLRYYYSAGDVVVTTPWYEPFGLTPLEAMACGRPVIGSAVGGLTYTIKDGETGLLVPPRDPASLATALRFLLEHPQIRKRMGMAARVRVEREFTWPLVAHRTADLYESVRRRPLALAGSGTDKSGGVEMVR